MDWVLLKLLVISICNLKSLVILSEVKSKISAGDCSQYELTIVVCNLIVVRKVSMWVKVDIDHFLLG